MSFYRTQRGESPAMIARKHGTSVAALMVANPHKPTTVVAGKRTFSGLGLGENLRLPTGVGSLGFVGDAAADAINALIAAGGPCRQANIPLVCAAQTMLGITVDGKWGSGSASAARAHVPSAPGGCSPTPIWWGAKGTNLCSGISAAPSSGSAPASTSSLTTAARTALTALSNDPNYCTSVAHTGTPVNTAVHNFKAAWNAANPSRAVPIGTGKYEVVVAAALWSALGGTVDVPPGCGAAGAPIPAPPGPPPGAPPPAPGTPVPGTPAPATSNAPAAVLALTSFDPCSQANAALVCQAQSALGLLADGKYGPGTAAAAQALGVNAPAACPPHTSWWGAKGSNQCAAAAGTDPNAAGKAAAAAAAAQAADAAAKAAAASTQAQADAAAAAAKAAVDAANRAAAAATTQAQADAAAAALKAADAAAAAAAAKGGTTPGGQITPPAATKGLSTGAIVAGAVGAAALVGLLAAAAMSKKPGHRGARGARGPSRRKKSGHKRKSSKRKKR